MSKTYKMTEEEIQNLVERTVEGVYNRLAEEAEEENVVDSVWELDTQEEIKSFEERCEACVLEESDGNGGIVAYKAKDGATKKTVGIAIEVGLMDEDGDIEDSEPLFFEDKEDLVKLRDYLNEVIAEIGID